MNEEIRNILNMLDNGEISSKKAISLIRNLNVKNTRKVRPARKIKIRVISGKDKINLPGIPFWLISFLIRIGTLLLPLALKHVESMDEDSKKAIELLKEVDITEFIHGIKACGPFDFVDITSDEDIVKISVL